MANYDVGPLPTDAQLEKHLLPCPDDADFDAPPVMGQRFDIWEIVMAQGKEIMVLRRRVKKLETLHGK